MTERNAQQRVAHYTERLEERRKTLAQVKAADTALAAEFGELIAGDATSEELEAIDARQAKLQSKIAQAESAIPAYEEQLEQAHDDLFFERGREVGDSCEAKAEELEARFASAVKETDEALQIVEQGIQTIATAPAGMSWYATAAEALAATDDRESPEVPTMGLPTSTLDGFRRRLKALQEVEPAPLSDVRGSSMPPEPMAFYAGQKLAGVANDDDVLQLFQDAKRDIPSRRDLFSMASDARTELKARATLEQTKAAVKKYLTGDRVNVMRVWDAMRDAHPRFMSMIGHDKVLVRAIGELGYESGVDGSGNAYFVHDIEAHPDLYAR